jgi:hypothetical protein
MSKLSDYSKFDHLDTDGEEDDDQNQPPQRHQLSASTPIPHHAHEVTGPLFVYERDPTTQRWQCRASPSDNNNNNDHREVVYEWEQSMQEVIVHVPLPPIVSTKSKASQIVCTLHPTYIKVGLQGFSQLYFHEHNATLAHSIEVSESTWTIEVSENDTARVVFIVYLQKANPGIVWDRLFRLPSQCGAVLNPLQLETLKQELMLERWQQEHAGFDFRGATFNGSVPDPRTYMGGVSYR